MSKLFKLREWLTIPEAAKHLSVSFGEEVTEADVLRLALDGYIKLSVNFVNHSMAKKYPREQIDLCYRDGVDGKLITGIPDYSKMAKSLERLHEVFSAQEFNSVFSIAGLWDLSMIGAERIDVEYAYQNLTGGPEIELVGIDGTFVEGENGDLCRLQTSMDDNPYCTGSLAALENIKEQIALENIDEIKAKELLDKHKDARKLYLANRNSKPRDQDYFPAGGLPKDAVWVVKTKVMRKFEERISGESETAKPLGSTECNIFQDDKALATRERNTLLRIIGVMAKDGYGDDLSKPYSLAEIISKEADFMGISIDCETIAGKLKAAVQILKKEKSIKT